MKELYIVSQGQKGFLREGDLCYSINERYIIQAARLESAKELSANQLPPTSIHDTKLVFVEQSFEPISRIKRGKFYLIADDTQPCILCEYDGTGAAYKVPQDRCFTREAEAYKFKSYEPTRDFDIRKTFVFFGNFRIQSKWKILAVDPIVTNEEVYVLQEVNGIGVRPILNEMVIPVKYFEEIESGYNKLLSEIHTLPESVIDHCRGVATSLLAARLNLPKRDLGKLLSKADKKHQVVMNCASIINRFHPRRKPNEKERHGLQALTSADADFAVQCIFQIIKELKWSKK